MDFLDFEQPIIELEKRIEKLKLTAANSESSICLLYTSPSPRD